MRGMREPGGRVVEMRLLYYADPQYAGWCVCGARLAQRAHLAAIWSAIWINSRRGFCSSLSAPHSVCTDKSHVVTAHRPPARSGRTAAIGAADMGNQTEARGECRE